MKKRGAFIISLALVVVIGAAGFSKLEAAPAPAQGNPVELKFFSFAPEAHDGSISSKMIMQRITERTNGLVKFKTFFGGALGSVTEVLPYLKQGVVDLACFFPGYNPGFFQLATINSLYYMLSSIDGKNKAYLQITDEFAQVRDEFTAQNIKFLFYGSGDSPILVTNKKIEKKDDFKGMKIRSSWLDGLLLKSWGATPVAVEGPDIYDSMSKGIIDGAYGMPPQAMVSWAIQEVGKNFIATGVGPSAGVFVGMNLKTFQSLPPDIQKICVEEGKRLTDTYHEVNMASLRRIIPGKLLPAGVKIYALPEATQAELKKAAGTIVSDAWIATVVKAGVNEQLARRVVARFIELGKQFDQQTAAKELVQMYETEFKKK